MNPFKKALKSLRRSPYQALVAFLVTYIALFLMFCFSTIISIGDLILNYYETQPQLIAFFKPEISNESALELINKLGNQNEFAGKIKDFKFITKEEAVLFAKDNHQDDPLMLELITPELLPASVEFSTYNPNDLSIIKDALMVLESIDEISFHEDIVETFLHWTNIIREIGLIICVVLLILAFLVMNVVIGMKVIDHRQSIQIMQIIGASKLYIRWPYLIEGLIYGWISCLLAWGSLQALLYFWQSQIQEFFGQIAIFPLPLNYIWWQLAVGFLISGLICIFAAWKAVSRIMRRKP